MTRAGGWAVQPSYEHANGSTVKSNPDSIAAATAVLGGDGPDPEEPGPLFVRPGERYGAGGEVRTEDGHRRHVRAGDRVNLPFGYHRLTGSAGERPLICSPPRCHLPIGLRTGGWALQLYAMRSATSWGIGDLGDLAVFGRWAAAAGNGFALVNPLSASSPIPPVEASPYLPSSRRFRSPLYLRIEEVAGAAEIAADLEPLRREGVALNEGALIDRDAVLALKLEALGRIYQAVPPAEGFKRWRREQGEGLRRFATYCAIAEEHGGDWRRWPAELHDPSGAAVTRARRRLAARVAFFAWLQWLLDDQLATATSALPVMQDLPIGVDPGGADVWSDRELFATGFSVGAPPDLFNARGQDWGQPPFNPRLLRRAGYAPFIAMLRAAFRSASALRIDHVMGLFRLYWIPAGAEPDAGVYVRYPADDLLDILALESVRAAAWVVGEDLGTVEPEVREQMAARDMLSYRLLWFEDAAPAALPRRALSAVTTHDLPTVAGLWTGADLERQREIGLEPNAAGAAEIRERLVAASGCGDTAPVAEVVARAYTTLAHSPSMAVAAALEDAAEVAHRPNIPGTTTATTPNWSVPLPQPLERLLEAPLARRLAAILRRDPT